MARRVSVVVCRLVLVLLSLWAGTASAQVSCSGVSAFANCTAYAGGASVVYNNTKYTSVAAIPNNRDCPPNAPYNPSTDNWWTNNGACSGGAATATATSSGPTPTRAPNATATRTATATATTAGGGGGGSFFQAAYWTQGDDPCTHSGAAGSGAQWQAIGSCSGCGAWSASTAYNGGAQVSRSCSGGGGSGPTATRTAGPTATTPPSGGVSRPGEVPADQWSYMVSATQTLGRSADYAWLLAAMDKKESAFGAALGGGSPSAGDGLMQVQPATRSAYSGQFSATFGHAYNHGSYSDQIAMGALIVSVEINKFGDYYNGLLHYNGGDNWVPGSTDAYGRPIDAPGYANAVMGTYRGYGGTHS